MYRFANLRVNDSLDGMLRARYTSEHWSCNRLRSLIICHRLHLSLFVVPFACLHKTPFVTSREISCFVSDYLILLHGILYSREVELLGADILIRDRSLEVFSYGESATEFAIVILAAFYRSFFVFVLIALPAGRFISTAILSFTASS